MKNRKIKFDLVPLFCLLQVNFASALTEQQIVSMAMNEFNSFVSNDYRNEYVYASIEPNTGNPGSFDVRWNREINGVPVFGDRVVITVNGNSGEIVHKYIRREQNTEGVDFTLTITSDQAKWIAEKAYGRTSRNPKLQIMNGKLMYEARLESGPIIGIDAKTGESQVLATPLGSSIEAVQTSFNPTQYYLETYGLYTTFAILILGGFVYYRKSFLAKKK
mgnify:CR=1 FL=1